MTPSRKALYAAALALLMTAGCASGGGGGGGGGPTSPPPPPPPTSPPPPPPTSPPPPAASFENNEYNRDYSKALINASAAYAAGGTGLGVTIAVIDTGIDVDHAEFIGTKISAASVDIYNGSFSVGSPTVRNQLDDEDGHGTGVASAAAGAKLPEGDPLLSIFPSGMHGVAFDATVLAIRSDDPDTPCDPDGCQFSSFAIAAAIDYAVASGADIINLSLGGDATPSPSILAAQRRAVAAGVIVVGAAGNGDEDGNPQPNPDAPANFAVDPFSMGRAVAVGAVNASATISSFSNRAGTAADFYVVAPGEGLVVATLVEGCGGGGNTCYNTLAAGTSFSSPQVAGALALLLDAFPTLAPEDAVQILLTSAQDLGAAGVDSVYGHGLIDLEAAFQPMGTTSLAFGGGTATPLAVVTAPPSGATGDWVASSGLLEGAVIRDVYARGFAISPELGRAPSSLDNSFEAAATTQRLAARGAYTPFGTAAFRAPDDQVLVHDNLATDESLVPALSMSFSQGPFSLAMGRGFSAPAPLASNSLAVLSPSAHAGGLAALTSAGDWAAAGYDLGQWSLGVRSQGDEERGYSAATLSRSFGFHQAGFEIGTAREADATFGGAIASRLGGTDGGRSSFAALGWTGPIRGAWTGSGRIEMAETSLNLPGNIQLDEEPTASAWTLAAERPVLDGKARFGLTLAQPLRAESGQVTLLVPVGVTEVNASILEQRTASLTPSGREIALESNLRWGVSEGAEGTFALRLADDPGHVASADPEASVWFGVRWTR